MAAAAIAARPGRAALLATCAMMVAACGSPRTATRPAAPVEAPRADTGLDRMERMTLAANRCWFKSGDPAFKAYSLAPELSSFSGRPRFLLVPRGQIEARPLLVVEGRTGSSDVSWYGPLLDKPVSQRIETDLARWRSGASDCAA